MAHPSTVTAPANQSVPPASVASQRPASQRRQPASPASVASQHTPASFPPASVVASQRRQPASPASVASQRPHRRKNKPGAGRKPEGRVVGKVRLLPAAWSALKAARTSPADSIGRVIERLLEIR